MRRATILFLILAACGGGGSEPPPVAAIVTVTGAQAPLFGVTDAMGANAVTSVSASGSTVTLQLTRALDVDALVSYGLSATPAVGWVLDTAGVAVPAFADGAVLP